jgi:hypothetical protein
MSVTTTSSAVASAIAEVPRQRPVREYRCGWKQTSTRPGVRAGRLDRRSDLGRVVRVVVDTVAPATVPRRSNLRPTPAKPTSAPAASAGSTRPPHAGPRPRGGVQRVVLAGHGKGDVDRRRVGVRSQKPVPSAATSTPLTCHSTSPSPNRSSGAGEGSTTDSGAISAPLAGSSDVHDRNSARPRPASEPRVVVELDVGHHRDARAEQRQAAVGLVGLGDQQVPPPGPALPPSCGTSPPIRNVGSSRAAPPRRRSSRTSSSCRARRPRRSTAATAPSRRAARRDAAPQAAVPGGQQLRLVGADGAGHDHLHALRQVIGAVADRDRDAEPLEPVEVRRAGAVASRDLGAPGVGDGRQAETPAPPMPIM